MGRSSIGHTLNELQCISSVLFRLTGLGTEPRTSVLENQEPKWNRNSRFRFGSASVLGFFGSVLGSVFFAQDCLGELFGEAGEHVSLGPPPLRGGARDRLSC